MIDKSNVVLEEADRPTWLNARQSGVGASEVAALLGISPWLTPLELYMRKTGEVRKWKTNRRLEWGLKIEQLIADEYQAETGIAVERGPALLRDSDQPFMLASLDRWIPGIKVVELKSVHQFAASEWGDEGTSEIPPYYAVQAQQQMACAKVDEADVVAIFLGSYEAKVYTLRRDEELITKLRDAIGEFMDRVRRKDPPLPDFKHPTTAEILAMIEPMPGTVTVLDDDTASIAAEYERLGEIERDAKKRRDKAKARLIHAMGTHEVGMLPDGRCVNRKMVQRRGYVVEPTEYARLSITKAKG